ncbi:hypothetical protein [Rufibacter immobilis]|nr:hypothetical protein [Rufibacter immobilis]
MSLTVGVALYVRTGSGDSRAGLSLEEVQLTAIAPQIAIVIA